MSASRSIGNAVVDGLRVRAANLRESALRRIYDLEDRCFDLRNGIRTRGVVVGADLHTDSPFKQHATAYHAVWTRNIRTLLRECFARGHKPDVFIDVGCGKGKACFYAARTRRFEKLIGFDFDATLIAAAQVNGQAFGDAPIVFAHRDATEFDLPAGRCFIFMFNPFGAEVMRLFLARNAQAIRDKGSVIAYANDAQREVLERFGFECFYRDSLRKLSLWGARA